MKLVARCLAALAVLAIATPALPCADKEHTKTVTASSEKGQSGAVAKSGTQKKAGSAAKPAGQQKPATAAN